MWEFDFTSSTWDHIEGPKDQQEHPIARSGHAAVDYANKMFIFGGIFEVTKELNDMITYDFATK